VPFDITAPRILMDLVIVNDFSIVDVVEALCDKFRRRMNIAFAERFRSSTDLRWKTMVMKEYPENELLAFELPDCPRESVFVPTRLLGPTKTKDCELDDTYVLVQMPSEIVDNEAAQIACLERFDPLFAPPLTEVNDKQLIALRTKLADTKDRFEPGQRLQCRIVSRARRPNEFFQRDDIVRRVANERIDALLNPEESPNFRWDLLRRKRIDVQMSPKGKRITKTTLTECLINFAREEVLDETNKAFCPHCRDFVRATKKMDLWTVPEFLIIQLKRFFSKGLYQRKLDLNVDYPDELDVTPFVKKQEAGCRFKLVAVIDHSGGLNGGHYVADVLHEPLMKWYRFSDDMVKVMKQSDAHSENGYVLFYEKQSDDKDQGR
jgi:ubiquitin carboxyl-terminal hydrolase 4/11/15